MTGPTYAPASSASEHHAGVLRALWSEAELHGKWEDAATWGVALVAVMRRLSEAQPGDHEAQLANDYLDTGMSAVMAGQIHEARTQCERAVRISQTLVELDPSGPANGRRLICSLMLLGMVDLVSGELPSADETMTRSVALFDRIVDDTGRDAHDLELLACALTMLGQLRSQMGPAPAAEAVLIRAVELSQHLIGQDADQSAMHGLMLASGLTHLGSLFLQTDRESDAEAALGRAVLTLQSLLLQAPEDDEQRVLSLGTPILLAQASCLLGSPTGSRTVPRKRKKHCFARSPSLRANPSSSRAPFLRSSPWASPRFWLRRCSSSGCSISTWTAHRMPRMF